MNKYSSLSSNEQSIDKPTFLRTMSSSTYMSTHVLPRLFVAIDTNKNNVVEFEEYLSAQYLFRYGNAEDKLRLLFSMYCPVKGGAQLTRESLRSLLKEAHGVQCQHETSIGSLNTWLEDMNELTDGMVDVILLQYAGTEGKLSFLEFCSFVKAEETVQALIEKMSEIFNLK
mmetsp:Transcript_24170/g.24435  ORF Transcript_24170/g.24435 Transcript_24170/m.24435 type:complete len:171 (-) Transcript_24170:114-626(-)